MHSIQGFLVSEATAISTTMEITTALRSLNNSRKQLLCQDHGHNNCSRKWQQTQSSQLLYQDCNNHGRNNCSRKCQQTQSSQLLYQVCNNHGHHNCYRECQQTQSSQPLHQVCNNHGHHIIFFAVKKRSSQNLFKMMFRVYYFRLS